MFEDKTATELRDISSGSHSDYNRCWEEQTYSAYAQEEMERRGYSQIPAFDKNNQRRVKWAGRWTR